jgi:hypothetical protein
LGASLFKLWRYRRTETFSLGNFPIKYTGATQGDWRSDQAAPVQFHYSHQKRNFNGEFPQKRATPRVHGVAKRRISAQDERIFTPILSDLEIVNGRGGFVSV